MQVTVKTNENLQLVEKKIFHITDNIKFFPRLNIWSFLERRIIILPSKPQHTTATLYKSSLRCRFGRISKHYHFFFPRASFAEKKKILEDYLTVLGQTHLHRSLEDEGGSNVGGLQGQGIEEDVGDVSTTQHHILHPHLSLEYHLSPDDLSDWKMTIKWQLSD